MGERLTDDSVVIVVNKDTEHLDYSPAVFSDILKAMDYIKKMKEEENEDYCWIACNTHDLKTKEKE